MNDEQELPREIGRGTLHVAPGLDIEVVMLSNGQRVVTPETMEQFFQWLADGPLITIPESRGKQEDTHK